MKILVIGFAKIKYMPYLNFYLENLDCGKNDVHLLYWNRDLNEEDSLRYEGVTLHEFKCYQEDDVSKLFKLRSFSAFKMFAKELIEREKFDFLFVLHTMPCVLLSRLLLNEYRDRYVFDYRDSTYERFAPFKKLIGKLVAASRATFVSSDGFRHFMPESEKDKIFASHNILIDSLDHRDEKEVRGVPSEKLRISFWGFVRNEEINREIIKRLSADARFELHYYGREQQIAKNLKVYAATIGAKNVFFHGEYKPSDRYDFVCRTDIIHNLYNDRNMMFAMPNKYYDGVVFRIPQICMPDSFMGKEAVSRGIGTMISPYEEDFADMMYNYYIALDRDAFNLNCDKELERVICEYDKGCEFIRSLS